MLSQLDKHIAEPSLVRLATNIGDDEDGCVGIPVMRSDLLLAMHEISDFHFDGYRVVRLEDVSDIRFDELEQTQISILKSKGEWDKHTVPD